MCVTSREIVYRLIWMVSDETHIIRKILIHGPKIVQGALVVLVGQLPRGSS